MVHRLETTLFLVYQWLDYSLLELKCTLLLVTNCHCAHTDSVHNTDSVHDTNSVHKTESVHDTDSIHNPDSVRDIDSMHNTITRFSCFKAQYRTMSPSMNQNPPSSSKLSP